MKYPQLVRPRDCTIPIHVIIDQEGISEEGQPIIAFEGDLWCNFQDCAKTILDKEKKTVQINGSALFVGDIAPDVPEITGGTVTVFGIQRRIALGRKNRNPDGTVNYTKLEVM